MAVKKKFPYRAAFVACNGGCRQTVYRPVGGDGKAKEQETAAELCTAAGESAQNNGNSCAYGCIGCGKCVSSCKFGAIAMGPFGVPIVDEAKCIACGRCTRECPQKIIHLHDCANPIAVACSNKDKGKDAKAVCSVSCIACGICEKTCTAEAIHVTENCAFIDESVCLSCGMCAVKCPRHAITDLRGILAKRPGEV